MYNWITLLYTWNYFNKNKLEKKIDSYREWQQSLLKTKTKRNKEPMATQPQPCDGPALGALLNDLQNHPPSWRLSPQFREEEAKTQQACGTSLCLLWAGKTSSHCPTLPCLTPHGVTQAGGMGRVRGQTSPPSRLRKSTPDISCSD